MIVVKNESEISALIRAVKLENPTATIGFVPTMGALHEGHLSLIQKAKENCDFVVCSIFVNPSQFNNSKDLATYPRTIETDKKMLIAQNCDALLLPDVGSVYPNGIPNYTIDLEGLDRGMEGAFRPGHFVGVCMVVERLFEMVKPHKGFFGNKDFQQLAIIRKMTMLRNLPIEIIGVPIKRNEGGLALSSRNALLTNEERKSAELINQSLKAGIQYFKNTTDATEIKAVIEQYYAESDLEIEYVAIVDNVTLEEVLEVTIDCTVCIVVFCGVVRLIDNMQFASVTSAIS